MSNNQCVANFFILVSFHENHERDSLYSGKSLILYLHDLKNLMHHHTLSYLYICIITSNTSNAELIEHEGMIYSTVY